MQSFPSHSVLAVSERGGAGGGGGEEGTEGGNAVSERGGGGERCVYYNQMYMYIVHTPYSWKRS